MGQALPFSQIILGLPQSLFGPLALGHVHRATHEFNKIPGRIAHRMACTMDVPDRTVRKNGAEIHLVIDCPGYVISKHLLSVLRMNTLGPFLKRRCTLFWLETKQAVGFRGREGDLLSGGVERPSTRMGQPLAFRQKSLTSQQFGGPFRDLHLEFLSRLPKLLLCASSRGTESTENESQRGEKRQ